MHPSAGSHAGLHPASVEALTLSNVALMTQNKAVSVIIAEHELAAEAHRKAAAASAVLRTMHEAHAKIHHDAAASMRAIKGQGDAR